MGTLSSIQKEITSNLVMNLGLSTRESLIEAKFILEYVLKRTYAQLYSDKSVNLLKEEEVHIRNIIGQRLQKKPLGYILKEWDFYGETFHINDYVLIPRQDTELLIDLIFKEYKKETQMNICDLGTGSGIIGITLAKQYKNSQVILTDSSKKALIIAQENINKFKLINAKTLYSDWYNKFSKAQFDLIVSNPPYIDIDDPFLKKDNNCFVPVIPFFI